MDIVSGFWTDSGNFPGHGGDGEGALGAPVVGPNGLIEILETARGFGAPATANVVRIAAFQAVLAGMEGPPRFWSRSLEVDAWATAHSLLRWRDELVDAGWDPEAVWASPRLADLAAADMAATEMPRGAADRIAVLVRDLESKPRLPVARICLIDARDLYPAGWRRLLDRLEDCGVIIEQLAPVPADPRGHGARPSAALDHAWRCS